MRQNVESKETLSRLATTSTKSGKLSKAMADMGNPFKEESWDLLLVDTFVLTFFKAMGDEGGLSTLLQIVHIMQELRECVTFG